MMRFVAIVGSGPAGFYAAEDLLKHADVSVDMIDRLPTPFGLVRAGIAPDHQKTKQVARLFERTATSPRFRFFGNLEIGRDATAEELLRYYDAVIFAHGAGGERRLGIPGEDKRGVFSANEFVGWYNGHPDYAGLDVCIPDEAVVVGNGNVAADVSRVLLMSIEELSKTDIAQHALEAIASSDVRRLHLIGRAGPGDTRFTSPELKELINLPGVDVEVADPENALRDVDISRLSDNAKRNLDCFLSIGGRPRLDTGRSLVFHFGVRPDCIDGEGAIRSVRLKTAGGSYRNLLCKLMITCIGNIGRPFDGLPFHDEARTIRHSQGRVEDDQGAVPGLYVTGWAKRGASGTVGTNRADSRETCAALLSDFPRLPMRCAAPDSLYARLKADGRQLVSFGDWLTIDESEIRLGRGRKPREKYVQIEAMLRVAVASRHDEIR